MPRILTMLHIWSIICILHMWSIFKKGDAIMKKRIIPVIIAILFLFGCAKEEAAPENEATQPTRKPILAEIVSAYDIGATGEKQVSELFESF